MQFLFFSQENCNIGTSRLIRTRIIRIPRFIQSPVETTSQSLQSYSACLILNSLNAKEFYWVLFVRIKRDPPVTRFLLVLRFKTCSHGPPIDIRAQLSRYISVRLPNSWSEFTDTQKLEKSGRIFSPTKWRFGGGAEKLCSVALWVAICVKLHGLNEADD